MKNLEERKQEMKEKYNEARKAWVANMSNENWKTYCEAKSNCMKLGVRI